MNKFYVVVTDGNEVKVVAKYENEKSARLVADGLEASELCDSVEVLNIPDGYDWFVCATEDNEINGWDYYTTQAEANAWTDGVEHCADWMYCTIVDLREVLEYREPDGNNK